MSPKFLIPLCAAAALLAACGPRDENKAPEETATTPGTGPAPAETPPPSDMPPAETPPSTEAPPPAETPQGETPPASPPGG